MTDARNKKDEIIQDLTGNIDKMTQQFAKMLSETLDKMKNRIQAANEQFKLENEAKNQFRIDSIIDPDRLKA